jgi:hypothetical protein
MLRESPRIDVLLLDGQGGTGKAAPLGSLLCSAIPRAADQACRDGPTGVSPKRYMP